MLPDPQPLRVVSGRMRRGSHLLDWLTLGFFRLFAGRLGEEVRERQYRENSRAWTAYQHRYGGRMIEHQARLSAFSYGKTARLWERLFLKGRRLTAAENSCEVIAVYNALLALERAAQPAQTGKGEQPGDGAGIRAGKRRGDAAGVGLPELLREFSARGICAHGLFGTSPRAVAGYFTERGYRVRRLVGRQITRERTETLEREADVAILTAYNRGQNPFSMVHTMCATRETSGWQLHNDYEGSRLYPSLYDALTGYRGGQGHPVCVLGIFGSF